MDSKFFIFLSILSVIVSAKAEDDWSCETVEGTPCSGNLLAVGGPDGSGDPYINATMKITCMDKSKQESNTFIKSSTNINNEEITVKRRCLRPLTPCITEFTLCIKDPNVSSVTLKCRYLKGFEETDTEDVTSDDQTAKCGPDGAKQYTHLMNTGHGTTTVKYSNLKIRIKKPIMRANSEKK